MSLNCLLFGMFLFVSACNRTYYGEVGKAYDLELHRPKEDKLPYICQLTLTAAGGNFGDIVQVGGRLIDFHLNPSKRVWRKIIIFYALGTRNYYIH